MKRIVLLALFACAASAAQAQAPPAAVPDTEVRIPAPVYTIELPAKPYKLSAYGVEAYRGLYSLSNGDEMRLRQRGHRIYATVGDQEEQELVAAAPNIFVAKDRNLKMTLFADDYSDRITGEVLIRRIPTLADVTIGNDGKLQRLIAGH